MPTLRSQSVASASGNAKKSSDTFGQECTPIEAASVFSNSSPPCAGPGTPVQDHEAARAGVPNGAPIIRRSRRLTVAASVDATHVEECVGLPRRKGSRREALPSPADVDYGSFSVDKGKRKAEEHLEEAFREFSCEKTFGAILEASSPGSIDRQVILDASDLSSKPSPAFIRRVSDREGVASSSKGRGRGRGTRGRGSCGLKAMLADGIPNKQPLPFDLNHSPHGSSSSEDAPKTPNTESLLAEGQVSLHLDIDSSEEDGHVKMLAEEIKEETGAHQAIEVSVDASLSGIEAGPSRRPQAELVKRRGGARGRGRHGGAEASRSRFLQIARDRAFHFAHFDADGDEAPAGAPLPQARNGRRRGRQPRQPNHYRHQPPPLAQQVDWPGPFSTARQLVNNRAEAAAARQNAVATGSKVSLVDWHPMRVPGDSAFCSRKCPTLQDLCLNVLSQNADNVESLEGVPEFFRSRISDAFCKRRKMSAKFLSLFFQGEPSELCLLDCTQVSEDELTEMMKQICPSRLEKLHLHNCGRALSEKCLLATIASPSTVILLKSISLRGAYRLSDGGLEALLRASPQLVHLDLSTCSFLTNVSLKAIACCTSETLESLVLDGCQNLNAMAFVHDVVRLQKLQKLSLVEVGGVTDEFVTEICVQLGSHLKELVLAGCNAITDAAIAAIGPCCPSLQCLDLAYLSLLTDIAIAYITDNLRQIQVLNVRRCKFSDEAIAAFVTASGAALHNLSLNSVQQVSDQTILALAKHSHACLERLDLSFCRLVDDDCLGFLADSCQQLQELKLYGCTQVTDKFLNGHSNVNLRVVGLTKPLNLIMPSF